MADMDTASKRLSTLDWDQPFQPGLHIPNSAPTAGDRLHGLWTYSGIEPSDVSTPGGICQQVTMHPAVQQQVWMTPAINQYVTMKPGIQQTVRMGCNDGC